MYITDILWEFPLEYNSELIFDVVSKLSLKDYATVQTTEIIIINLPKSRHRSAVLKYDTNLHR